MNIVNKQREKTNIEAAAAAAAADWINTTENRSGRPAVNHANSFCFSLLWYETTSKKMQCCLCVSRSGQAPLCLHRASGIHNFDSDLFIFLNRAKPELTAPMRKKGIPNQVQTISKWKMFGLGTISVWKWSRLIGVACPSADHNPTASETKSSVPLFVPPPAYRIFRFPCGRSDWTDM